MEEINPQTNYTTKAFYTAEEYKRLEQENAELKTVHKTLQQLKKLYDELVNRVCLENYERLEQENEELKEEVETWKYQTEKSDKLADEDFAKAQKYRKALEEIRGICKKVAFLNGCDNCDGIGFYDGCLDDDCGNYACFKILDKINEVLGNE